MFHLVGWHESKDSAVLAAITAMVDPTVFVTVNQIAVPALDRLMGCYAGSATLTLAQLSSPSLRRLALLDIAPINIGAEPVDERTIGTFHNYFENPIQLDRSEALTALIAEGAAGAEDVVVLAWLGDKIDPIPTGKPITARYTNATTLVAYAWTVGALTPTQALPAGRYAVVGARALSAGMIAFRLLFSGYQWRPGALGVDAASDIQPPAFRNGGLGVWGEFEHDVPPSVEFLSVSGDSAQVVHLDLVQTRSGRA